MHDIRARATQAVAYYNSEDTSRAGLHRRFTGYTLMSELAGALRELYQLQQQAGQLDEYEMNRQLRRVDDMQTAADDGIAETRVDIAASEGESNSTPTH